MSDDGGPAFPQRHTIEDLGFPKDGYIMCALRHRGIRTLRQLDFCRKAGLLIEITGIGLISAAKIEQALDAILAEKRRRENGDEKTDA